MGRTLSAELPETNRHARAFLDSVALHQIVARNVSVTANAPVTWLASTRNAKIRVLELAAKTLTAELSAMRPTAIVAKALSEIHLVFANLSEVRSELILFSIIVY